MAYPLALFDRQKDPHTILSDGPQSTQRPSQLRVGHAILLRTHADLNDGYIGRAVERHR